MKFIIPLLFAVVVFVGFGSALTPMIAGWLVPVPEVTVKKAEPGAVADALHQWFDAEPQVRFTEVQGLHRLAAESRISWMTFKVDAQTVSRYIHRQGLSQDPLDQRVLTEIFHDGTVPAEWWMPAELNRETWFSGIDAGRQIGLIYDAERQKGYLVARTLEASNKN